MSETVPELTQKSNIVLIGYRGTGKSTVAGLVGALLKKTVISVDSEIVSHAGKTIPEIVAEFGWEHFRDMESEQVEIAAVQSNVVIDAGGGAVLRERNVAALKRSGICFLLTASVSTIASRIGGDANRPSLTGLTGLTGTGKTLTDEIEEVLAERNSRYNAAADFAISTETDSPEEIAKAIVSRFRGTPV